MLRRHQTFLGSSQEKARKLYGSQSIPMLPHFTGSVSFGSPAFTKDMEAFISSVAKEMHRAKG